jgi:adenylate cyclase, class 2
MPIEIEAKMKCDDLEVVRVALRAAGAVFVGRRFEVNVFFDTASGELKNKDVGVRVRSMRDEAGDTRIVMTYKGPKSAGPIKAREEIEFGVDDLDAASIFLARLGFAQTLRFEKRRESWTLHGCDVELDELPVLGTFVEIEGASEDQIMAVRQILGLGAVELTTRGYASMVGKLLADRQDKSLRFQV